MNSTKISQNINIKAHLLAKLGSGPWQGLSSIRDLLIKNKIKSKFTWSAVIHIPNNSSAAYMSSDKLYYYSCAIPLPIHLELGTTSTRLFHAKTHRASANAVLSMNITSYNFHYPFPMTRKVHITPIKTILTRPCC